jgi:hypothetical protein
MGSSNMDEVEVEITSEPGIIDPGSGEINESSPYDAALTDYLSSIGPDSALGVQFRVAQRSTSEETSEGDWRAAVIAFFTGKQETVVETLNDSVDLAAYWLDVPPVEGAKTKLSVVQAKKTDATASFKIAGCGGGPRYTVELKGGISSYTTSRRRRVALRTEGRFQVIEVTKDGKFIDKYIRLVGLNRSADTWTFEEFSLDVSTLGTAHGGETLDYKNESGELEYQITINRGEEFKGSLGLKLPSIGLEATSEMTIGYQSAVTMTYTLPAGHCYRWDGYPTVPVNLWTLNS